LAKRVPELNQSPKVRRFCCHVFVHSFGHSSGSSRTAKGGAIMTESSQLAQVEDASTASSEAGVQIPTTEAPKLRLQRPHRLVQRTMDLKPEKDAYGYVRQPAWPGVDIRVSKSAKRNALIVLDRLFKALEKVDVKVDVLQQNYGANGTFAVRDQDKVQLHVSEAHKKVAHEPTAKELREKERYPTMSRIPKWDDVPTGKLTLNPGGVIDLSSEAALGRVIAKAVDDIIQRLDVEREGRLAAEAARRREWQRQQEEQAEKTRVEALYKASDDLHRYRLLMDYIEEVRRFGRVPEDQLKDGQTLQEWLQWAEWRARIVHPLG
jgi:hypothetical protein